MRLRFTIDDETAFHSALDELVEEVALWVARQAKSPSRTGEDVSILLEWRFGYSTGELDRFTIGELEEYLLEWCPRKLSFPPDAWLPVLHSTTTWIEFLGHTGHWRGGLVQPILDRLKTIEPEFIDAMGDTSKYGLGKGMFMSPALGGADIDLQNPESLQAAIEAFNALPMEERTALTEPFVANQVASPAPVELTIGFAPNASDVLAAAESAPIISHLAATADYLGDGRALTQTGNLKLADARRFLSLWETDDIPDHKIGDHEYKLRSAADLGHLDYLLDGALAVGALQKRSKKLVVVKKWRQLDPIQQVSSLFDALIDIGPVYGRSYRFFGAAEQLMEEGLPHWLVPLLYQDTVDVDEIVTDSIEIVQANVTNPWWRDNDAVRDSTIARCVEHGLDVLVRCGLVLRDGVRLERDRHDSFDQKRGGTLTVTPLGRHLLPAFVERGGYRITSIGDVADLEAADVLGALDRMATADLDDVWRRWWPDRSDAEKARALIDAIGKADHPTGRLNGFAMLTSAGSAAQGPVVELFDTPLADHAALFLLDNELMTESEVAERLAQPPLAPMVDLLATELDIDSDAMLDMWNELTSGNEALALELIDSMWRVDLAVAVEVLDALGRLVTDKRIAKAARKAAFKFRSKSI